jgi:hypothetical protein
MCEMRLSYSSRSWRVVARESGRWIEEIEFWRRQSFWSRNQSWSDAVAWRCCTDDDFGEAFKAEGGNGRDSAVLKVDFLQLVSIK